MPRGPPRPWRAPPWRRRPPSPSAPVPPPTTCRLPQRRPAGRCPLRPSCCRANSTRHGWLCQCQYSTCAARANRCAVRVAAYWGARWGGGGGALLEFSLLRLVLSGHLCGRRLLLRLAPIGRLLACCLQVCIKRLGVASRLGLLLHPRLHRGVLLTSKGGKSGNGGQAPEPLRGGSDRARFPSGPESSTAGGLQARWAAAWPAVSQCRLSSSSQPCCRRRADPLCLLRLLARLLLLEPLLGIIRAAVETLAVSTLHRGRGRRLAALRVVFCRIVELLKLLCAIAASKQ